MSNLINQEKSLKDQSLTLPSKLQSLSPKVRKIKEDFFNTYENMQHNNKNIIQINEKNSPYERLKILEQMINVKNKELFNINNKLNKLDNYEKKNKKPLIFSANREIYENNKIKEKLNIKNLSLGKKFLKISEKIKKIEDELLYRGSENSNYIPIKEKLKEVKSSKEYILLKMKQNDEEIKKINDKEKKNSFKEKKKKFLENLEKIKEISNSNKNIRKKNPLLLTDNNINANEVFNKCLYEEEIQQRRNEEKIKEQKYKELREKELEKIKKRKENIQINNERYLKNNKWIQTYARNKNYLSWDEKEKERINNEEALIELENNKRKIKYSPISSEELNKFSNDIRKKQLQVKNELKQKRIQLEEIWKERKALMPEHKSKFQLLNKKYENDAKEIILLKQEQIKGNILEKINFSYDVSQKHRPKLINDKLKKERIEKIKDLKGDNRKNKIKALTNKLKLKSFKIIQTQPKNFKLNNVFKAENSVAEQQLIKLQKRKSDNNNIILDQNNIDENDNLVNEIKIWKKILNNNGDIFNIDENKSGYKEENKKYKIIKNKSNQKVNKSSGNSDINTNIINISQKKEEKYNKNYINNIKTKLNILNKIIEE